MTDDLILVSAENLTAYGEHVEAVQRALDTERQRADALTEQMVSKSWFKNGGYVMFNRPHRWLTIRESNLPQWVKVAEYCACHHNRDGHRPITGDFGETILGKKVSRQHASEMIEKAIDNGLLGEGSNRKCLVAPYYSRYLTTEEIVVSCCDLH